MTSTFCWTSFFKSPTSSTSCFGDPTLAKINQVISVSMCETVLCVTKCATKPPNTKTWACMYLQEEPSTAPIDEPSRDTDAHDTYRSQCNHEFTGLDVVAYLGKGSSNHSPGPMEVFKTQADYKSISIYDPCGLPILLIPKAQITMQGIQVPWLSTSTFYHGPRLSELLDHIFAGYLFLCLIDAHGNTLLLGFYKETLDSGQSILKSSKPSFGWHTQQAVAATTTFSGTSSLYYMCHGSQCYSNLVTSPSSCVLLTLQSVLNQNLTCQSSSSYCRIPMIFDTLK